MKRFSVLISSLALLAASGCHNGSYNSANSTQAILTSNNYKVIMTNVKGDDAGFKVFGIGNTAQYSIAMEKIRVQAQLEDRPRALINVTQDENWWTIGIVAAETLTLTADVIEFTGPPTGTQ